MRKLLLLFLILFFGANIALAATYWVDITTYKPNATQLNDVYFLNETTGYAAGNDFNVWKTTDRGLTWNTIISPISLRHLKAIKFPTSLIGYAAVAADEVGYYGGIYKTTDGGLNWTDSFSGVSNVSCYGLYAYNNNTVWVAGWKDTDEQGAVWRTIDGTSWNESLITDPGEKYILHDVYFSDASTGCTVGMSGVTNTGKIWYSTNGGISWNAATTSPNILRGVRGIGTAAWAVGDSGTVLKSSNLITWGPSSTGIPSTVDLYDVHFIDTLHGWVVGKDGSVGAIYYTDNGGTSWTSQTPGTIDPLYGVHFVDQYNGWAVGGSSNLILKWVVDPTITSCLLDGRNDRPVGPYNLSIVVTNPQSGATLVSDDPANISISAPTITSPTSATATITIGTGASTGSHTLTFTNPDNGSATCTFTVNPLPTINYVDPTSGAQGATALPVTIHGTGFLSGITTGDVSFGPGITVTSATRDSSFQISVELDIDSGAATGPRDVTVTNPDGGSVSAPGAFNVSSATVPNPTITSASPNSVAQGTADLDVVIDGTNFEPGATVSFSHNGIIINPPYVVYISPNELTMNITVTSTAPAGSRIITVKNPSGGSGSSTEDPDTQLRITAGAVTNPTVTSVDRPGYIGQDNQNIYVYGTGFKDGAGVYFSPSNGITIRDIIFENSTGLRVFIDIDQNAQTGLRDVTVENPDWGYGTGIGIFEVLAKTPAPQIPGARGVFTPNPWNPRLGLGKGQFRLTSDDLVEYYIFNCTGQIIYKSSIDAKAGINNIILDGISPSTGMYTMTLVSKTQNKHLGNIKFVVLNRP